MSKSISQSYSQDEINFSETKVKFLQIEPTTRCNFKCEFCCGRQMDQNDLNLLFIERVLKLFPSIQHIELQGEGEPLLHAQFFEMVKLINQRNIKVSFITNGSLLTPQKIEQILNSHIQSICISIESADKQKFREIRGGDLTKILLGIESLIYTRNKRMQNYPSVGFAVTVLNCTKDQMPLIADLYNRLGMDGGIRLQFLSEMQSYIQVYNKALMNQRISQADEPWIFSQYIQAMQNLQRNLSYIKNFYDELEETPNFDSSEMLEVSQFFNRIFCSCLLLVQLSSTKLNYSQFLPMLKFREN